MHAKKSSPPLCEKYAPRTWGEVVAQPKAVKTLVGLRDRYGLAGRAYWLSGQSGTGKTTLARLIAAEVAERINTEEIDGRALTLGLLRQWEYRSRLWGFGKGGHAFIVNEAHGLRRDVVRSLLVTLDPVPGHIVWVFTSTTEGQQLLFEQTDDAHPLLSRCSVIMLSRQGLAKPFAERAKAIARTEGLDGKPMASYVRLMQECRNNLRAAIQAVQDGVMMAP